MDKQQLKKLLDIGENAEIEFKESKKSLPKSLWETYSSFSNTNGGFIVLGIKEDKESKSFEITGVENVNNILKDFWNSINNEEKVSCNILNDDYIDIINIESKNIIVIRIPRANRKNKPIYINNNPMTGTYKRFHDGDYKCSKYEVSKMISEANEQTKDKIILEEFDIENINIETLNDYRKSFKIHKGETHAWNKLDDEEFLCVLNAMDRKTKKLTLAGLLMFGKETDIVQILPNYFLDYREINEKTQVIDERWSNRITSWDESWTGNLWDFFEKIVNKLTADIPTPFALNKKMMRIDDTNIHKAVREALANCLTHFQSDESGSIVIEKGEDYFKFANPGDMRISIENAFKGGQSDPRNALLHKMFSYLGYGERAGSGLSMINTAWKERGWIAPKIEEQFNPNRTTLLLYMKKENQNNNSDNEEQLNKTQIEILNKIKENSSITQIQLAEQLGISRQAISKNIKILKENNILKRKGSNKKGEWDIKSLQ